jgi:protein-disulfide isomerase/uncharacterized membrane protein
MNRLAPLLLLFVATPAFAGQGTGNAVALVGGSVLVVALCGWLMATRRSLGLAIVAGVGGLLSIYLAFQHNSAGGGSICNVSSTLNCDVVNTSVFSEMAGVPIAIFGLGYYAAMAALAVRHHRGNGPDVPVLLVLGGVLGVGYDAYLAWASATQIHAWCVFCVTTWAINLILLIGGVRLQREAGGRLGPALRDDAGVALVAGLLVFIVAMMGYRKDTGAALASPGGKGAAADLSDAYHLPRGEITLDGTEPVAGDPNARFTLVEWADYECPHCGIMSPELKKLLEENKDTRLLFRHYPISGSCNEFVEGERHKNACGAAVAAECARQQGRFWEVSGQFFKNQAYLGPDDIRFIVERQGLDMAAFSQCIADPAALAAVKADVQAAGKAQIDGTPSIFLLGAFGDRWVQVEGGRSEIEAVLAAARSGAKLPEPPPAPAPE